MNASPIPAVSGVIINNGRVLMVRRCNPPNLGGLALPGGKIHLGESTEDALIREVREETSLIITPVQLLDVVTTFEHASTGKVERQYVIISYLSQVLGGSAKANDDACELQWLTQAQVLNCQETCHSVIQVTKKAFAFIAKK